MSEIQQMYKIRSAKIDTYTPKDGGDPIEFASTVAGTMWGKPVSVCFFIDYQIAAIKEAIAKNTVHLLEPIPGNIGIITVPAHYKKRNDGTQVQDDNGNPVVYTQVAVFYRIENGETAETRGAKMFRDFIKSGNWELATTGEPSTESNEPAM